MKRALDIVSVLAMCVVAVVLICVIGVFYPAALTSPEEWEL